MRNWLGSEAGWTRGILLYSIGTAIIYLLWVVIYLNALHYFEATRVIDEMSSTAPYLFNIERMPQWLLAVLLAPLMSPLMETIVFVALPLDAAVKRYEMSGRFVVIIIIAIIFAHIHGGWTRLPVQGLGGIMFGILYLKCGGWSGKMLKPVLITTFAHQLSNSVIGVVSWAAPSNVIQILTPFFQTPIF